MGYGQERRAKGALPFRTPFYYGWLMVAVGAIGVFFSGPGQTYSNAVYIASYVEEFGMSQTAVASVYSAATLASGLLLFFMGRWVDRYGRRAMMTAAALLLGASCLYNSFVVGPATLFFGFFLVRYFGQGSMTLIPNTLVSQWFVKYRGRALAFAALGGLLGAAAFPPLTNALIDAYGWRASWRIVGVALLVLVVPVAFVLVRNRPEDVGLRPDGAAVPPAGAPENGSPETEEAAWTLAEAMRTRAFWFVMVCGAIPAMVNTGLTFQLFAILAEQGVDRHTTAYLLGLIPLVSFGCSLLSGFVVERVKAHRILALAFALNLVPLAALMYAQSYAAVLTFAVSWGVAIGVMNIPFGVIWPNYFGRKHLGSIQGFTHTAGVIGSALGPIPFGWAFDRFGSYSPVLAAAAVFWVIGSALALFAPPPSRDRSSA
ncbi:MFS transporter [Paenibacillus sp.]|uniref:MFS transporter n=1 Tax=Paenibacillus sp. TaxID=58172 RepID=UPI002D4EAB04|nr:MFS transporter [Paenibacillus sp.]HZG57791.1 MFS transporter [Paenibacillus sp.]